MNELKFVVRFGFLSETDVSHKQHRKNTQFTSIQSIHWLFVVNNIDCTNSSMDKCTVQNIKDIQVIMIKEKQSILTFED